MLEMLPLRFSPDGLTIGVETAPGSIAWFAAQQWQDIYAATPLSDPNAEAAIATVKWFRSRGYTLADLYADPARRDEYARARWAPIAVL